MAVILYWNVGRKDLRPLICAATDSVGADVVIVLESGIANYQLLESLRTDVDSRFYEPMATFGRFHVFCRDAGLNLSQISCDNRASFRRFTLGKCEMTLGVVHMVDRLNHDDTARLAEACLLSDSIRRLESDQRHERTVLVGDFNMNPFDPAMNVAHGFNAMMSARCVERRQRTYQERTYPFFYNPMWNLLGDWTPGPPGTYYNSSGGRGAYGWNLIDQVLMRPDVVPYFKAVNILESAGSMSLASRSGHPNRTDASDHFPLVVTFGI